MILRNLHPLSLTVPKDCSQALPCKLLLRKCWDSRSGGSPASTGCCQASSAPPVTLHWQQEDRYLLTTTPLCRATATSRSVGSLERQESSRRVWNYSQHTQSQASVLSQQETAHTSDDPPETNPSSRCPADSGLGRSSPADLAYLDSWTACPLSPLKNSVYLSLLSLDILKDISSLKSALTPSIFPSQSYPLNSPSSPPTSFQARDAGRL